MVYKVRLPSFSKVDSLGVLELIHNAIDEAAVFTRHEFCEMEHISALYPVRYNMHWAIQNGDVDVPHLVELCKEVRYTVQEVVLHGWEHICTYVPLIEERLLCCTGDPSLSLAACWDRRPRGTFLDFGWTRTKPDMPPQWSFFAHCKPETLLSILIEICEGVCDISVDLSAELHSSSDAQAWHTITLGSILRGCYARRILIQPQADDFTKYKKHCLYVLAALDLMNTFFKSNKIESWELVEAAFSKEGQWKPAEDLLQESLSTLATAVLCPLRRSRREREASNNYAIGEVFLPRHLDISMLRGIGSLKVDWTEYMYEHLKFDCDTMTVYIYWFASHIYENQSRQ